MVAARPDPAPDREAAWQAEWRKRVEAWTSETPDPAHWIETRGAQRARADVEHALREGASPILLCGPPGHGKTFLLRALQTAPPTGHAPLLVPISNVEPDAIERWILAAARQDAGSTSVEGLKQIVCAHAESGLETLLLLDEIQSTPPATLAKLFEMLDAAGARVATILAGLPGEALDRAVAAVPRPLHRIELAEPWTRSDTERLLAGLATADELSDTPSCRSPADLEAALDRAALDAERGNPRLVRAALRRQLLDPHPRAAPHPPPASLPAVPAPVLLETTLAPPSAPPDGADSAMPTEAPPAPTPSPLADRRTRSPSLSTRSPGRSTRSPSLRRRRVRAILALLALTGAATAAAGRGAGRSSLQSLERVFTRLASLRAAVRAHAAAALREARKRLPAPRTRLEKPSFRLPRPCIRLPQWRGWLAERRRPLADRIDDLKTRTRSACSGLADDHRSAATAGQGLLLRAGQAILGAAQATRARMRPAVAIGVGVGITIMALGALPNWVRLPPSSGSTGIAPIAKTATVTAPPLEPIPVQLNAQPWAVIEVDGIRVGSTPITVSLTPGAHLVRATLADGRIVERIVDVSEDRNHHAFR